MVGLATFFPKLNQFNRFLKILHMVHARTTSWSIHKAAATVSDLEGNHAPFQKSRFSRIYLYEPSRNIDSEFTNLGQNKCP